MAMSTFDNSLVTQFVNLLGTRQKSLLLSDLGALMNGRLRHAIKEKGGLRTWVQRYPEHFFISGQPGKETVSLVVPGSDSGPKDDNADTKCETQKEPVESSNDRSTHESLSASEKGNHDDNWDADMDDEDAAQFELQPILQLRGLPYRAQVNDIITFLGLHANNLKSPSRDHVQLVLNRDGRPSGFARLHFVSADTAKACKDVLHLRCMDERYVEVFLYNERLSRRKKEEKNYGGTVNNVHVDREKNDEGIEPNKADDVLQECITYLQQQGRGVLLSMLGVALSPQSREYLKQTDQGLKHFLANYGELSVEGTKGCEFVCFMKNSSVHNNGHSAENPLNDQWEESGAPKFMTHTPHSVRSHVPLSYPTTESFLKGPYAPRLGDLVSAPGEHLTSDYYQMNHHMHSTCYPPYSMQQHVPQVMQQGSPQLPAEMMMPYDDSSSNYCQTPSHWESPTNRTLTVWAPPCAWMTWVPQGRNIPTPQQKSANGEVRLTRSQSSPSLFSSKGFGLDQSTTCGGSSPRDTTGDLALEKPSTGHDSASVYSGPARIHSPEPESINSQEMRMQDVQEVHDQCIESHEAHMARAQEAHAEVYPSVVLRNLPLHVEAQDVLVLFSEHGVVQHVAPSYGAVQMHYTHSWTDIGSKWTPHNAASVTLNTYEDMQLVKNALNDQWMAGCYISVYTEPECRDMGTAAWAENSWNMLSWSTAHQQSCA